MLARLQQLLFLAIALCPLAAGSAPLNGARLGLRLVIPDSSICTSQSEVPVELFLTNDSQGEIEFTENGFGTGITYFALYDSIAGSFRSEVMGSVGDWLPEVNRDGTRLLRQGQPYRVTMKLSLPKKIFDRAGFYKLQVRYSGIATDQAGSKRIELNSNWGILETHDCSGD
ncbi:MAG TPA: hypothetical protein VD837_17175 [Terriglobales bacterium]|nr:hypothetical protein [Terriglobales bacterium]